MSLLRSTAGTAIEYSMNQNQENPGENSISRKAAGITIAILLCLCLAGGIFLMLGKSSAEDPSGQTGQSAASETSSKSLAGRAREWLGIDTILSILDIGNGYTVVKADPSTLSLESSTAEAAGSEDASAGRPANDTDLAQTPAVESTDSADAAAGTAAGQTDANTAAGDNADAAQTGTNAPAGTNADAAQTGTNAPAGTNADAAQAGTNAPADANAGAKQAENNAAGSSAAAAEQKTAQKDTKEEKKEEKKDDSPTKLQKKYIAAWEDWHMRDFPENFPLHNYNWKYLSRDESGILRYEGDDNYMIRRGIDVSEFQGKIDWEKVKKAGYDFVFVRVGHRTMHTGDLQRDNRAIKNLTRAKKAGLDVGAYIFSQSITEDEAREEAKLCLDVIKESGIELTLPIVFDPEIVIEDYYARINFISGKQFTDNAVAFCEEIKKAGYTPAIYANCSTETDILDMSRLKGTTIWYADYSSVPETPYDFTFWQYSNLGWVDGIPETETDLNVWFIKK